MHTQIVFATVQTFVVAAVLAAAPGAQTGPPTPPAPRKAPIRNLTTLHGAMHNTVTGMGLVTGLRGTGSGDRASRQALRNFIRNYGMNVTEADLTSGAVALVSVSAELPPFAHVGMAIDVTVATLGDATSIEGGMLENTPLSFFDGTAGRVYVTASGPVSTGGFAAATQTAKVTRNNPTTGTVARGGKVVEAIEPEYLTEAGDLELMLRHPSLLTANHIVRGINRVLDRSGAVAEVRDEALVRITMPREQQSRAGALRILGLIAPVAVEVENPSKVIIDSNTGLVIVGEGVQISPCVVTMADLTISIVEEEEVVQPLPGWNRGRTEKVDRSQIDVEVQNQEPRAFLGGGANVADLLANLRALDLPARQLVEVFKRLDSGGFLHAPLEIK